ncbi:flippase-like domain-containing protein [Plantactinospora sp. S1510]|uniref:Flippase-like domain-containing protein n=1 Tax=Plantactinospora alkalitolerans TaxID=2789879 RepID=A0ABS0H4I5_9ACTN|nr:lysylphosphatidylglycerol synthase transmembrane domain-containing protein [Plantactinospora alkalitolerans]MBF9133368.1 flippase-like domain-containing protein [Plantactinospora alkalitolerans]
MLGGAGILALLLWRLGSGAFLDGLHVIDGGTLLVAAGIGLLTTVFSAWRWCLVARGLGIPLPLRGAVADYYRGLFLNAALPGGVLGDVHRAVRHGRDVEDVGRGVRAVVLERAAGQVVLVTVGVAVLLASPLPGHLPAGFGVPSAGTLGFVAAGLVAVGLAVGLVVRLRGRNRSAAPRSAPAGPSRWARAWRTGVSDVRLGLLARRNWPGIVLASAVVLAGHLATFVVAARAVGVSAPVTELVPLMLLALLAMTLPVNIGGWGPREGVTAWAFGAVGLTASAGLTIAVVYGVLAFVASLPGAGVLAVRWFAGRRAARRAVDPEPARSRRAGHHHVGHHAVVRAGHRRGGPEWAPALRLTSRSRVAAGVLVGQLSPNRSDSA